VRPETFCERLRTSGLTGVTFQKDEPPGRGWSCVADLVKPKPGDDAAVSSLFVSARGFAPERLDVLRLKLNLIDPSTSRAVLKAAGEMLRQIFAAQSWRPPDSVMAAIPALREGRIVDRGVSYELRKEFGTPPRANLVVTFPRALGLGGSDSFAPVHQRPRP
jgi:hypothetical protein